MKIVPLLMAIVFLLILHDLAQRVSMASPNPHEKIETAARNYTRTDPGTVSVLADAVFDYPGSHHLLPSIIQNNMKSRILYAELSGTEIQEQTIADTFNTLAQKLNAPSWTLTNQLQVHAIRAGLQMQEPTFMSA